MLRTFLREKQNAAKVELLTIGEQDTTYDKKWTATPFAPSKLKENLKQKPKKVKTEMSSPRSKLREQSKQALKIHLQQLNKQSNIDQLNQVQQTKSIPLKPRNFNNEPHRTVEQIYMSKQRSEEKMRPLIYVQDFKKQYEEEQQKLRTIIKRKMLAKDLFKRSKNSDRNESALSRNFSLKQSTKKNFIFVKHRNLLPHIF